MNEKVIKIEYHSDEIERLKYIDGKSDWIDLRAAERVELKAGDFKLISLGVSMRIPEGYEAHLAPRSSTFKTWGIIQTNSVGVVVLCRNSLLYSNSLLSNLNMNTLAVA